MKENYLPQLRGYERNLTTYGDQGFSKFLRRAFLSSAGYDQTDLNRPIVGIADTSSDYNTCHRHVPEIINAVKRGVLEAGGLPLVFPTISLGEILISPTSMLYRNLLAMETEEMLRAYPMDSVVLIGGCDKTIPAQLMAAASANLPAIFLATGPMSTGNYLGERIGACTDCRRYWAKFRAGEISVEEIYDVNSSLCPTSGTCMVMGSASTIACITEALGLMLPLGASALSGSAERLRIAVATGRKAVNMAHNGPAPREVLTRSAFENAIKVLLALGGSTNAVIHLIAVAGRCGIRLSLDDFNKFSREIPLLVNCKPSGTGYMEDIHRAGGIPVLLKALEPCLDTGVNGLQGNLGEYLKKISFPPEWQNTIKTLDEPLGQKNTLVLLKGSLAPDGAIIKCSAASSHLMKHKGTAVVFDSIEEAMEKIDDPSLGITEDNVLVLRNAGPVACGMPEAGSLPIPKYLAQKGVKDMVRVSDARMSGTAYGTVILHCSPEAAVGGNLALVQNGDVIELDVDNYLIQLHVSPEELSKRKSEWTPPPKPQRGYKYLYANHVQQSHLGADFDFLLPSE